MATRRAHAYEFDHGTQYFTARSRAFRQTVERWKSQGIVGLWNAHCAELDRGQVLSISKWGDDPGHYVGVPGMNHVGKHLAKGLDVRLGSHVQQLRDSRGKWQLSCMGGDTPDVFDWVISTAPAAQTAALLPDSFSHHAALRSRQMKGCFALMLGFQTPPELAWQAARVRNADISWISVNNSKPGRPEAFSLLVHASHAYSDAHIEASLDEVSAHLAMELQAVAGVSAAEAEIQALHRWRYADVTAQDGEPALVDVEQGLAACGDWCIQGRVEAAFTSAMALSESLRPALQ